MRTIRTTVVAEGLSFPEAPRWRDGRLYVSDFLARRIAALDPASGDVETILELDDSPSGLGWRPDGAMMFVSMAARRLNVLDGASVRLVADLGAICAGRANDMVVTRDGGAFIGNFGFDMLRGAPQQTTRLCYVSPTGEARAVGEELLFPNGIVLLDEERTLVVAETYANRLTAFDVGGDGELGRRRTFAQFGEDIAPDGICADAEGAIWVASARSGRCVRVAEGGELLADAVVPEGVAYACMLGGESGRDLFICAAPGFRPPPGGQASGKIHRAEVDVPRAGRP